MLVSVCVRARVSACAKCALVIIIAHIYSAIIKSTCAHMHTRTFFEHGVCCCVSKYKQIKDKNALLCQHNDANNGECEVFCLHSVHIIFCSYLNNAMKTRFTCSRLCNEIK